MEERSKFNRNVRHQCELVDAVAQLAWQLEEFWERRRSL